MINGHFSQSALVLREAKYKEADRIITLYSSEEGKITAKAQGALRKNSKFSAATQMLTYSDITLFGNKGKYSVTEASIKEEFKGLRENFENYALACYFTDCIENFAEEDVADKGIMQLILNSLYALSNNLYNPLLIKAAFELRLMCLAGYTPDLNSCSVCGKENPDSPTFGYETGHICCRKCRNAEIGLTDYLCSKSLLAMKYIISCPPKSLFSFDVDEESLKRLSIACEDFLIFNAGHKFSTLDYWKHL